MGGRDETAAPLAAGTCANSTLPVPPMGVERAGSMVGAATAVNGSVEPCALEPPRKRPKLATDDTAALRKRIIEYKLMRLKSLRDRFTEQLSELYFLQAGGNMMDYTAWRKRPAAPQLLAFLESRRPPPLAPPPPDPPPPPCDITQQQHITQHSTDEVVEKAKQEAYVARRVAELSRAGLWAERRLPRVLEPPRPKSHWDYLLEEMAWLAQDFAHERKWKKQAAKKCARAVQKYFQDKAAAAQKAEKAQEMQLKKIAAFAAKEIRMFWTNVEKLVEWKRSRRVERARKEALDEQLSYIVDRTERYSRQLAANLRAPHHHGGGGEHAPSPPLSDYGPDADDSADDENTIAEQERRERPEDTAAELDALRQEAELGIDELVKRYANAAANTPTPTTDTDTDTDIDTDDVTPADTDTAADTDTDSDSPPLEELVKPTLAGEGDGDGEGGERRVEACASLAAALQPTGTTLADTAVGTPVPRLLRHTLREYQHVGLHWLATMHARHLNGILADEMGLGKTIQTIALLAHLALELEDWGPHLVVAPTSVVLNWEMEFKKWCPAFKILTYYGTIKERKAKRVGWTKANSFHVCITSYKLVVQDHQSFRRKKWKYLILDEAQNIKNFKSQRWQMLLNFQTERRLLLTGTPLQNSLLELWSLMHFLMPSVFASHSHFREWFADVAAAADGAARNDALVRRLHEVLRPFLLRRLKADVERQMPRKYEHVLLCRLSKRQRFLYDDFMARAKTKESLASGNLLSVINVLMQLRKVCNHPDLFEPRPVVSPLQLPSLRLSVPALVLVNEVCRRRELSARLGGDLATLEADGAGAFVAHRARHLAPPHCRLAALSDGVHPTAPRPPPARLRLHLRLVPRAAPPAAGGPPPALRAAAPPPPAAARPSPVDAPVVPLTAAASRLRTRRSECLQRLGAANERRCWRLPLYGSDLRDALTVPAPPPAPRDIATVLADMADIIDRFSVCWAACRAHTPVLCAGAGQSGGGATDWRRDVARVEAALTPPAGRALAMLHAPATRQAVAFPHPRLLQYDCGKLQTLSALLRTLKAGGHRVLIFTQMTRVLDVLEAFLSMHGHTYLRLDGATRVDARQPLVERFNSDARVFAMILSTRSGGVGLNLTGADCVVFYDSDWNPTMDAQAQDRAHRIGQTRDVHVFRLVTAATVEENILRKADQKRALGHLAIEDGHFTTSYLRQANIKELFGGDAADVADSAAAAAGGSGGELETALAAAEDEVDAAAARQARAEQRKDLAEFDETQPLDEEPAAPTTHAAPTATPTPATPTPAAQDDAAELAALMKQLTPIEKYAMRVVESSDAASEAERVALDDMRRQLREWEDKRRRLREPAPTTTPPPLPATTTPAAQDDDTDDELTYSRHHVTQVWVSGARSSGMRMPIWGPPTPPHADTDVYCDMWARVLYRAGPANDATLPPPAPRRGDPRAREQRRRPTRIAPPAPPSMFERAGSGSRPRPRATRPPPPPARDAPPPPEWAPHEDAALRRALRLQRLPAEPPAALAPNWEWAADLVNDSARSFRSARQARDRHDALLDPDRAARRKHKKVGGARRRPEDEAPRPPLQRLDAMRDAAERRRAQPKRRLDDAPHHNPKHAALLHDHGVDYDAPPTPMEVATRRADRIAKEKLKAGTGAGGVAVTVSAPVVAPPQRIVVATQSVSAGGAVRGAPPSGGATTAAALYRHQPLAVRQHLKILHHAPHTQGVGVGVGVTSTGTGGGTAALQQLALRRGGAVVAHLTPAAPPPAPPTTAPPPPPQHQDDRAL